MATPPISTRKLDALPPPDRLLPRCRALGMLDAILFPDDWESRYHSFDAAWGEGEQLFQLRDGCGDFYFLLFHRSGDAVLRGFGHESAMSPWSSLRKKRGDREQLWPGLFEGLPRTLDGVRTEPAFGGDEITFCAWWSAEGERAWRIGAVTFPPGVDDPDGSAALLFSLDGEPQTYCRWAEDYTEAEQPLRLDAVAQLYALAPLTEALVRAINPEAALEDVREEAQAMGYPLAR